MNDDKPAIIHSSLERRIEDDGTFVQVHIYRGEDEATWIVEVVDEEDASTVYDDRFESDQAALNEVTASIQKYGIRVYLEDGFPDAEETVR
ncbi:MAG: hypothetical protein ACT6RL_22090 [Neoaquamicrobium sediminum]|uniref:hypothetical protein n=1 Tax=Neoaquamicrobium sediminum TaxID=1849104 RepID=UPI0040380AD7